MTNASETMDDEYEEYDEFDEEDDERGLSGFSVLVIGLVMIGAFISVVWIAYQQGIKTGAGGVNNETPYVAADPEPMKIESADASEPVKDREVYDVFDGENDDQVTMLAEQPEEPVTREADDTIGAIAAQTENDSSAATNDEETRDHLASLQQEDAAVLGGDEKTAEAEPQVPAPPTQVSLTVTKDAAAAPAAGALSGSHVLQVGALSSNDEAMSVWGRLQNRMGDYLDGKSEDVEVADVKGKTYYRLRIGPFGSYDEASEYCAGLKQRGQDCLVKKL